MPSSSLSRLPQILSTLAASLLAVALSGGAGASAQSRTALQPPADSAKLPPGPGAHGPGSSLPAGAVESADGKRSAWVSGDGRSVWSATRADRTAEWGEPDRLLSIRGA